MLPSSVRRVVASAPSTATLASSSTTKAAAASAPVFLRGHQRRLSSSKPSRPDDGSKDMTARSMPSSRPEKRKRKAKDHTDQTAKLPSVPSTQHMAGESVGLSSFFSLHRPISITQTIPRTVTNEHFASIFGPRSKNARVFDTINTVSSTIDSLEGPMASMTIGQQDQGMDDQMHKLEVRNPDGSESSIQLQVSAMSGDFLPFRPPPTPQPQSAAEAESAAEAMDAAEAAEPQHRVYKAMFTIEETTEPGGQIRINAHSPQIVQDEQQQPRSFLERLAMRQVKFDQAQESRRGDMLAISVKRQRKLRMKKKKYKKLMKRTRNERRKLDRT
ncbi:DUF1713 domain protein [Sarocladium implicatum]|nr:DUF1713 domain protein [Sarocladium implicatum]